ncbi:MAG: SdrD B-like domain-containing protein [Tepidisphaerales bacterium]
MKRLNTMAQHHTSRKSRRTGGRASAIAECLENRLLLTSNISGTVYRDVNLDGIYEAGVDQPLQGWTVYLDNNLNGAIDNAEPSTTTDANGVYQFSGLAQGNYVARVVLPVGWRMSDPKWGYTNIGPLNGIDDATNINFGVTTTVQITGTVYDDANGSGTRDISEAGVPGWTVYLDTNNNGILDAGEQSVVTDAQGGYVFDNLPAANYTVRLVPQAGMRITGPASQTYSTNIPAGSYWRNTDFGVTGTDAIAGSVFIDSNANGTFDAGDLNLPNWTVYIDANNNGVLDPGEISTTTAMDGTFIFPALANQPVFHLRVDAPLGWSITQPISQSYDLVMQPGQSRANEVFGLRPAATTVGFSGKIFQDNNRDGVQQLGEPGLAGWVVYIDTNHNGVLDPGEPMTWTDISGNYELPPQVPGNVRVSFVAPTPDWYSTNAPAGYIDVIPHTAGDVVVAGTNFGLSRVNVGRISGVVFQDTNLNGVQDAGEVPLAGARVYMGAVGAGNPFVTTDANGNYAFNNLAAGTYTLIVDTTTLGSGNMRASTRWSGAYTVTVGNGSVIDEQSSTGPGEVRTVTLPDNRSTTVLSFGMTDHFAVTGSVVFDSNGDGLYDQGEPFLAGWTVFGDLNQNGVLDPGEPTAVTDSHGYYYLVFPTVNLTAPTPIVIDLTGHTDAWGNTATWIATGAAQLMIQPYLPLVDYRFTVQIVDPTFLVGQVFNDANRNGFYDAGDSPIPDVKVYIDLNGNGQFDINEPFAYTDQAGQYVFRFENVAGLNIPGAPPFEGILTGKYHLRVAYDPTVWQAANPIVSDRITTVNPGPPEDPLSGVFFGLEPVSGVTGKVFVDQNANGAHDLGESGQAGVTVYIDSNNNGILDPGEQTAVTDATGAYVFYQVPLGQKVIREIVPGGYRQTRPGNSYYTVNVTRGTIATAPEFGNTTTGMIRGRVFYDLNQNGVQDPKEPGLAGSDVYLDTNQNGQYDVGEPIMKTNTSGNYVFNGLAPGVYRVAQRWATNYQPSSGVWFSDVVVGYGQIVDAPIAGNLPRPTVSGYVFDDRNLNGIRDRNESFLAGAIVYIDLNNNGRLDGNEDFVQVGLDGKFSFILPGAGTYTIRVIPPVAGMTYSKPAAKKYTLKFKTGQTIGNVIFGLTKIGRK